MNEQISFSLYNVVLIIDRDRVYWRVKIDNQDIVIIYLTSTPRDIDIGVDFSNIQYRKIFYNSHLFYFDQFSSSGNYFLLKLSTPLHECNFCYLPFWQEKFNKNMVSIPNF